MCRGEEAASELGRAAGGRAGRGERGSGGSEGGANCTRRCPERSVRRSNVACPPRQGQNRHCACPADFKPSPETAALATAHAREAGGRRELGMLPRSGVRPPRRRGACGPASAPAVGCGQLRSSRNGSGRTDHSGPASLLKQMHPRPRGTRLPRDGS